MILEKSLAYYGKDRASLPIEKAVVKSKEGKGKKVVPLLWGDELYVDKIVDGVATACAKGYLFRVPVEDLRETPLLSVYQIDCGQGDAALVQFPDGRWMMVDGGPARRGSNCGKIAADFLCWKMFVDQVWKKEFGFRKKEPFRLDALVCTHPDADHFGGFGELTPLIGKMLSIGTVFHNGMGRFAGGLTEPYQAGSGFGQLGPLEGAALPEAYLTALIDGFEDVRSYAKAEAGRAWTLSGDYAKWLGAWEKLEGKGVERLQRLDRALGTMPGFVSEAGSWAVRVLGPVTEPWKGKPALRYLDAAGAVGAPSLTRNGHSVVLRLDYGTSRILLTGDLNFRAQVLLLKHVPKEEFRCDVAKACHHGSEDVSWTFLEAMNPLATIFSSGDNEAYAHPRARALGLAGAFGRARVKGAMRFLDVEEPRRVAPLIYSTELSRSVELYPAQAVYDAAGRRIKSPQLEGESRTVGGQAPRGRLKDWRLARGLVYGLINVRTDGRRILLGAMKDTDDAYQVEEL